MNAHPHGEQLSAYLDGMLDVAQMRDVAGHLGVCPSCQVAYQGLEQTKSLLGAISAPSQPAPEFWTDAYRQMRVEDTTRPFTRPHVSWDGLRSVLQEPQRRWSAGLAAAAVIVGAVISPLFNHGPAHVSLPMTSLASSPTPDSVDVSSLVQAHTASAARQPLADADRQDMIAMDASFMVDDPSADMVSNAPDAVSDATP